MKMKIMMNIQELQIIIRHDESRYIFYYHNNIGLRDRLRDRLIDRLRNILEYTKLENIPKK